jgi:hypothetical protein
MEMIVASMQRGWSSPRARTMAGASVVAWFHSPNHETKPCELLARTSPPLGTSLRGGFDFQTKPVIGQSSSAMLSHPGWTFCGVCGACPSWCRYLSCLDRTTSRYLRRRRSSAIRFAPARGQLRKPSTQPSQPKTLSNSSASPFRGGEI